MRKSRFRKRRRLDPLGEGGVIVPADGGGVGQRGEGAEDNYEAREEFHSTREEIARDFIAEVESGTIGRWD
jgi:hypothetical protein